MTGVGKAGLIARKVAATLSSTGTRSHFVHPTEALHGDLGCVGEDDVWLMFSNSGETEEIVFLGTGLIAQPHQSGNPGDSGKIMFRVLGTDYYSTNNCACLNPPATLSPGVNGPATPVQDCIYNQEFNNDGKPDLLVKFDQNDLAYFCTDAPMATYVLSMFCTDVQITAVETVSGQGNKIITNDVSGPQSGYLTSEGQLSITPCK